MFVAELLLGFAAGSVSLQADALDFLGDAANYGISLLVTGLALHYRARATLVKGVTMGGFGLWILGSAFWHSAHGTLPSAMTMGQVGVAALLANALDLCAPCGSIERVTATCSPSGCAPAMT